MVFSLIINYYFCNTIELYRGINCIIVKDIAIIFNLSSQIEKTYTINIDLIPFDCKG